MLGAMKDTRLIAGFAPSEREYIRRELDQFFSTLPTVAEGFQLRVWRGGQRAGEPKIPPHAKTLLARGLMRLDASQRPPSRLFFTDIFFPLVKFAHVRRELGIDPVPGNKAAD